MRCFALIFVLYLSLLNVTPAVCATYIGIKHIEINCDNGSCSTQQENKDNSCDSENNTSCITCCSLQNCTCNIVGIPNYNFIIPPKQLSKNNIYHNDKILSNYLSDCWHPPEEKLITSFIH